MKLNSFFPAAFLAISFIYGTGAHALTEAELQRLGGAKAYINLFNKAKADGLLTEGRFAGEKFTPPKLKRGTGALIVDRIAGGYLPGEPVPATEALQPLDVQIEYMRFGAEKGEKGSLVVVQGFGETYSNYIELFYDLHNQGYSPIYALDHRGQGGSTHFVPGQPQKSMIDDFANFAKDLNTFVGRIVLADRNVDREKLFLVAHSMGGAVAADYLQTFSNHPFKKSVLYAPMFKIANKDLSEWALDNISSRLARTQPFCSAVAQEYSPQPRFTDNSLSSSALRWIGAIDTYRGRGKQEILATTYCWLSQSLQAVRHRVRPNAGKVNIPMLVFSAEKDRIVDNCGQYRYVLNARETTVLANVPDSRHQPHMERDEIRESVLEQTLCFLEKDAESCRLILTDRTTLTNQAKACGI